MKSIAQMRYTRCPWCGSDETKRHKRFKHYWWCLSCQRTISEEALCPNEEQLALALRIIGKRRRADSRS